MELKNKTLNFLGDSITEGVGTSGEGYRYFDLLAKNYGLKAVGGYGISGTRFARQQTPSDEPRFDQDFISRVETMDADADAVVIFGGTNDFGHGDAPFGKMSDRTPDTFYGACHVLMQKLIERFPGKPIVFMTPLHRLEEEIPRGDKPQVLADFVAAIKEVAAYYSLPILDLFSMSGIQPGVPIIQEKFCPDGLHPNDAGHVLIAERLGNFLSSL